jgi:hypothetical protein
MNKDQVKSIIESTLKSGSKSPGMFDLPKILGLKSKLESCSAVTEVLVILEDSRTLVTKSFGVSDAEYNEAIEKIKTLDA